MTDDFQDPELLSTHHVGALCAHWAYLEYLLEQLIWRALKLDPAHGAIITGPLEIEKRARTAHGLADLIVKDPNDIQIIKDTLGDIGALKEERHLAVHGVRTYGPDFAHIRAMVTRGTMKYRDQDMSPWRTWDMIEATVYVIGRLERMLLRLNIIEGSEPLPLPEKFPELLATRYQRAGRIPQGYESLPGSSNP